MATAAALLERLTFVALSAVVASRYAASLAIAVLRRTSLTDQLVAEDLAAPVAALIIGLVWISARLGRTWSERTQARWVWSSIAVLAGIAFASGAVLLVRHGWTAVEVTGADWDALQDGAGLSSLLPGWTAAVLTAFITFGWMLPATGPAQTVVSVAGNLPQPRVPSLRRTLLMAAAASMAIAVDEHVRVSPAVGRG